MMRKEPQEASAPMKFRLLMWKNFIQHWRHRAQTMAEVVFPVITLSLILILRWQIEPSVKEGISFPPVSAYTVNYSLPVINGLNWQNFTQITIAYSPENPMLEDVIRSAIVNLLVVNVLELWPTYSDQISQIIPPDLIPPDLNFEINPTVIEEIVKSLIRVQGYPSGDDLIRIYVDEEDTRNVIAAVEFSDTLRGENELPDDISYALRFPERPRLYTYYLQGSRTWRTDISFPRLELPGPRSPSSWIGGNDPGYVQEMFLALQNALSLELISRMTGQPLQRYRVVVQRFPYPSYVEDAAVQALQILFPMFIMLSFSYTAVNITRAITVEKENHLKETMKTMGLPTWLHWTAWFCKQFIYMFIMSIITVILLKVNWFTNEDGYGDYAVFTHTPWTVLLFFLNVFFICMIFFCFMISGFFSKGSRAALFMGQAWFLTYIPAFILLMDVSISTSLQVVTCLSINSAMAYGFQLLLASESRGGLQWGEFMSSPDADSTRFVFGHVIIMLTVDCVIYMALALYLEQVLPGPLGTPRPWYFPIQRDFWCPRKSTVDTVVDNTDEDATREKDPTDLNVGVKLTNVTKAYAGNKVVNNFSLNIYDDQITVLLGHNGAGKSTTISMITGNASLTSGSIMVGEYDVSKERSNARSRLSLCPQHNVLFNELTVREHLEFFARLKGFRGRELYEEIDALIDKLELQEKRNFMAGALSGGQKRRLSVGIALSGAARVVLLDEPTSGMDPAARRALWDLLQSEKKGRSMILTTHYMDEADILGDRVAIMAHGKLQCVGSPYFLKQLYGVGYTLVVVKQNEFDQEACTRIIGKYIPNIAIKEDRGTEVTYSLTNDYSHTFENMLNDLESHQDSINFEDYGLVATTLEDVFMSVGTDVSAQPLNNDSDSGMETATDCSTDDGMKSDYNVSSIEKLDTNDNMVSGIQLCWQHVRAMWLKLWLVAKRSWILLLLQVLVPILSINASLGVLQYMMSFTENLVRRPLTIAHGYTRTETLLNYNGTSTTSIEHLATEAYRYMFSSVGDDSMRLEYVDEPIEDVYMDRVEETRHRMLIGATFSENVTVAWFSNEGYHDIVNSLATVHTALLKATRPNATLNVFNHPLEVNYKDTSNTQMMLSMMSMQLATGIGTSLVIVSAVYVMFYIRERTSGAKLLQQCAGVRPLVMWGTAALFDWLWFLVLCISIVAACFYFNVAGLTTVEELARLYLCFAIYGAAMLPLIYLLSHVFKGAALGFVLTFFVKTLFGMIGAQIVETLSSDMFDTKAAADGLDAVLQFFPLYGLVTCVRSLNTIGLAQFTCLEACEFMSAMLNVTECTMASMCENYSENCCIPDNAHLMWETPGVLRYLVSMMATAVVLWIMLMLVEYRVFQRLFRCEREPPPVNESTLDKDVLEEMKRIRQVDKNELRDSSLVVRDLSKFYGKYLAVDHMSFRVGETECFGLLGVNGAGKTTTFKMLTGDETISSGDAYVSGHSIKKELVTVYNYMGYCPQFDATFPELTGRENLRVFAMLRGLRPDATRARIESLAAALGFTAHLDKRLSRYSGGNKRKASVAVSLLGDPRVILVDEPTSGVDPAARRAVWRALMAARRAGRGVLLTSHSMEECEALCSTITIMVNGRAYCLGSPQHLKNKFSQGFTLTIKIKVEDNVSSTANHNENYIQAIKNYVTTNFTEPKLMEQYQGLLTYYLPDRSVAWSKMFGIMERAKRDLEVEDYTISQTTLEQIFLQFTKYQRDGLQ